MTISTIIKTLQDVGCSDTTHEPRTNVIRYNSDLSPYELAQSLLQQPNIGQQMSTLELDGCLFLDLMDNGEPVVEFCIDIKDESISYHII